MFTRRLTRRWSGLPMMRGPTFGKCRETNVPALRRWSEPYAGSIPTLSFGALTFALCIRSMSAHTRAMSTVHPPQNITCSGHKYVNACQSSGDGNSYTRHETPAPVQFSTAHYARPMSRCRVQRAIFASVLPVSATLSGAQSCDSRRFQSSASVGETDYYAILGVRPDASLEEIKSAYKKLALQYHPDKNHEPGAEETFKNISAAYQVVGNKEQRRDYDAQRAMFSRTGGGRGAGGGGGNYNHGQHTSWGSGSSSASYYTGENVYTQRHSMSKEEADKLFRDIFGGMNIDQIFRNFDQDMRRTSGDGRGATGAGSGFPSSVSFNHVKDPFRSFTAGPETASSHHIFVDAHGNRLEETTYVDSRGKKFTVRRTSSTDPHASVNQTDEDYYRSHSRSSDGGYRFGQSRVKPAQGAFDSFKGNFSGGGVFGAAPPPANPFAGIMYIAAWSVVIFTLIYCFLHFLLSHPIFTIAVVLITALGGKGMRR